MLRRLGAEYDENGEMSSPISEDDATGATASAEAASGTPNRNHDHARVREGEGLSVANRMSKLSLAPSFAERVLATIETAHLLDASIDCEAGAPRLTRGLACAEPWLSFDFGGRLSVEFADGFGDMGGDEDAQRDEDMLEEEDEEGQGESVPPTPGVELTDMRSALDPLMDDLASGNAVERGHVDMEGDADLLEADDSHPDSANASPARRRDVDKPGARAAP